MSMHDGHRDRLRERFRREGLDNFDELYVLELLLYYCIPRVDTNPIAHRLLEHFGSLTAVLEATPAELEKVDGIGESSSTFLSLITQVGRYYQVKRNQCGEILTNLDQCGRYMVPYFFGREVETVFILCLDAKSKVLCCKKVGEGSVNSANVPVRRLVEIALGANASSVVLAHNHPGGLAMPSVDDVQTTQLIAKTLKTMDVILLDHVIVSDDEFVSFLDSGLYKPDTGC